MMDPKDVNSTISITGWIRKMPDGTLRLPPGTCRGLLAVGSVALGALTLLAGPDTKNLGPHTRGHFMPEDFESQRADGRYESSVAWAQDMVRNMKPIYSLDTVKRPEDFPAWRAKVRAKLRELLQVPDPLPKVEFKLLEEEPRDGYRLRTYEFYPEPKLAVRMMMLVPDAAAEGKAKVPAMVSLPGSGASLESLAGEPDEYVCHFPARNRQSWFFAKMGIVGVALENPATAHNSVEGVSHFTCQAQFARLMTLAGRSNWGFVTTHVLETIEFLRSLPFVDAKRVGVAGMSLGCIPALYSAVLDEDIAAVVYNDFVSSWAANATSVTKRLGGSVDARRPYGFHKWFDDEPDLMAAVAPRPMIFAEGGSWKNCIEKVQRGYMLAGASKKLAIRYYEKYADPASRKYEDVDLHQAKGLTANDYLIFSNVDAGQHSFHPDVNLPWLAEVFFGKADFSPAFKKEIDDSVSAKPAW
jgi:hypothetical protein